jgi:hypothetical protein
MKHLFSSSLLTILFHGFFQLAMAADGASHGDIFNEDQLPLTGDLRIDNPFKEKLLKLHEGLENTEPLTKKQAKRYNNLNAALGLDQPDLRLIAKGLATPKVSAPNLLASTGLISPDNIKTMPLGASIWASQSLFARRSIFDMGVLRGLSLIPDLQGSTESGLASKVSSRVDKNSNSEKFTLDVGTALRLGGFQASIGYKRDTATEKTSMGGKATASVYNYATNTLRIEPEQGSFYRELKGALKGTNLGGKASGDTQADPNEILKYINLIEVKVNPSDSTDPSTYKHITFVKKYDGQIDMSPRAHIQALSLLENYFAELSQQYKAYSSHTPKSNAYIKASQSLLIDLYDLKDKINGSIKDFYVNWGDSFVSEITGYSEIQGQGQLVQKSGSANREVNNAGSLTAGYSNFIWATETNVSVSDWVKNASAYSASEITTNIYQRPNNGVDLSGYNTALIGWLNTALKENGNAAALPAVAIQPTLPKLPVTRPWQDDPFAPPKEVKEWKDWKESREAFKNSKYVSVPDWLKKLKEDKGAPPVDNPENAREDIVDDLIGGNGRDRAESISNEEIFRRLAELDDIAANSVIRIGANSKRDTARDSLYENSKKLKQEFQYLKAEGKKQRAADSLAWKKLKYISIPADQSVLSKAATPDSGDNELFMDKMLVSGFKTLPFASVLEALRPNLDIPASGDRVVGAFVNTSLLLATLNKFNTIDTYLNFINSIPESGLQRTSIPDDFHKVVNYFQDEIMKLVQGSMSSGQDVGSVEAASLISQQIGDLYSGGKTLEPRKTKLFNSLRNNLDYYNYIYQLTINNDNFLVIQKAPGGYLPLARRNARNGGGYCVPRISEIGQFDIHTTYNSQPRYLGNSDCMEVNSGTDIPRLLAGNPQTPLYPLFIYAEKTQPMLNFVQFVGGSRLVIGRDITLVPPVVGDLTAIPKQGIPSADSGILGSMGYKTTLLGDPVLLKRYITDQCNSSYCFSDQRLQQPATLNAFLPSDISWNYSLWFQDNEESSIERYEQNQILIARIGMYAAPQKLLEQTISGENDYFGRGATPLCSTNSYCPVLTYQFMAPYSYQVNYSLNNWGLGKVSPPPKDSYLAWSDGIKDFDNNFNVSKVSLFDVGNSSGTKYTGGLLMLYPITKDMLEGAGSAGFTYSSGSSPKDIFNQDDAGNSPFDAGFTRALLQQ